MFISFILITPMNAFGIKMILPIDKNDTAKSIVAIAVADGCKEKTSIVSMSLKFHSTYHWCIREAYTFSTALCILTAIIWLHRNL